MLVAIRDDQGTPLREQLGAEIAHGGEGVVYTMANPALNTRCVKVYHPHKLDNLNARGHEGKLEAMIRHGEYQECEFLAWPRRIVYDETGSRWIGYVMPRASGFALDQLCHLQRVRENYSSWRRSDFCRVTLSLLRAIRFLHDHDDLVGDINPRNILVDPHSKLVTLLDCDSMHFTDEGRLYPCTVALPNYVAPELQMSASPNTSRNRYSERFSLALLLGILWLLGKHPFSCVVPEDEDPSNYGDAANILNGRCPLRVGSDAGIPPGPWGHCWMMLPEEIQELFVLTFVDALSEPSKRAPLDAWHGAFSRYLVQLESGALEDTRMVEGLPQMSMRPPPLPRHREEQIIAQDADARAYEFNGRLIGAGASALRASAANAGPNMATALYPNGAMPMGALQRTPINVARRADLDTLGALTLVSLIVSLFFTARSGGLAALFLAGCFFLITALFFVMANASVGNPKHKRRKTIGIWMAVAGAVTGILCMTPASWVPMTLVPLTVLFIWGSWRSRP